MAINYSFGWRPSPPDSRDRLYSAPAPLLQALPPKVDLSLATDKEPWASVWNQGSLGSCGPQTAAADLVFAGLCQQRLPSVPMPSRLFIYHCTRTLQGTVNEDSGVDNRSLLKALARFGWCDEQLWPYNINRFREKPPQACYEQAAGRKIVEYLAVPQDLNSMRACLAGGDPFIFGFSVFRSMMKPEVERSGDIPLPGVFEQPQGGHDVLIVGYDDATQRFKLRNSWGSDWGRNGWGSIPYEYATSSRLASDFWTVKASALPAPTPIPIPDPVPVEPIAMWKKLGLALLLKMVDAFASYAATTPDPLDDTIAAVVKKLLEGLQTVESKSDIVAALDNAKSDLVA